MADETAPPEIIDAHVLGHIRVAVKYAKINSPDAKWYEVALAISTEAAKFAREIFADERPTK